MTDPRRLGALERIAYALASIFHECPGVSLEGRIRPCHAMTPAPEQRRGRRGG